MADTRLPWELLPSLEENCLRVVATELLNVLYDTEKQLSTPLDDNYSRGTTTFARQKNRLTEMCVSGRYSWLKLTNPNMDLTFEINGIPVRFFSDNPDSPKKRGFFRHNAVDCLFAPSSDIPSLHRFVIEKPENDEEEARVHFIGYNDFEEPVSHWVYGDRVTVLQSVDSTAPESVEIMLDEIEVGKQYRKEEKNTGSE
ncbi:hypothetical protein K4H28_01960 [Deefgea tanakiae]|uniref:Uncharacterized protein n=1 Tax=Deefgea tanakiae TaxID=2865840 RepID=A0ABX8Z6J9_9NEIS|nr:hypothetical protein [Deefgea tanakiae]QZA78211.1 hypothetical protein K4H28_01960 [Deefgea tanakiae]